MRHMPNNNALSLNNKTYPINPINPSHLIQVVADISHDPRHEVRVQHRVETGQREQHHHARNQQVERGGRAPAGPEQQHHDHQRA